MELTNSQKLVITEKDKSILVSASAGSGKTFVVVERIIEKIKKGTDVNKLLVLTFTNAAALELKERIISRLTALKEEYLEQNKIKEARQIARQINLVPASDISTIHAFCLQVIKSNFYILGIDPNVKTIDGNEAYLKLLECINDVIEEEYELKTGEFLDILDMTGGEQNLIDILNSMYTKFIQMENKEMWLKDAIEEYTLKDVCDLKDTKIGKYIIEYVKEKLTVLSLELEHLIDKLEGIDDLLTRKDVLNNLKYKIDTCKNLDRYDEMFEYMPVLLESIRLPSTKVCDEDLKNEVTKVKNNVVKELKTLPNVLYKDTKGIVSELNEVAKYIVWYRECILKIHEKYSNYKIENGLVDFHDYEQLTLKAFEDENIRKKYMDKFDEIYIDEYQDTSYIQESIISKIAKDNVIMVGDVKQSIYGFRNAAPELFSAKYEKLEEITKPCDTSIKSAKIVLAQNFRSREEVINITNLVFGKLMSLEFGGAKYGEREKLIASADYEKTRDCIPELHIIEKVEDEEENTEKEDEVQNLTKLQIESVAVAKKIKELTDGTFNVYDLKKKEFRPCEYKDIVILMRTVENKANVVEDVLKEFGIPAYSDARTGFFKSDEILLVISFLKVLNNPLDDISLASIMYSIIGGFTLDEMTLLRYKNTKISLRESLDEEIKDKALKEKVEKFKELLNTFKTYLDTYNISYVLNKLYNETGLYLSLGFEKMGKLKQANLDAFMHIISEFEKSENTKTLNRVIKYIDTLKSKETAGDSPKQLGENENVVRIMTMHKSKGLEFPVVILMNTDAKYNEQELTDKVIVDSEYKFGIDIYNKELKVAYPSIIKQVMKINAKNKLRSETLRLLYVAFTRAKEKLIIFGTLNNSLDSYTKDMLLDNENISILSKYKANSHLKCILQVLLSSNANDFIKIKRFKQSDFKVNTTEKYLDREKESLKAFLNKAQDVKVTKEEIDTLKSKYETKYNYDTSLNQKYTVTNLKGESIEENLSTLKPQVLTTKLTGTSYGTLVHKVIELVDYMSLSKEGIKGIVESLLTKMDTNVNVKKVTDSVYLLYSKYLKDMLDKAKVVKHELEFVVYDTLEGIEDFSEPTLIQGVVDMYIKTENENIIIDFKTDKVENKDELIDRYKNQLRIYKKALEVSYNETIDKMYIYSFSLEELIEVTYE